MGNLAYSIDGSFITDLALEKFYYQNDLSAAINLLKNCLITPQIPESETMTTILRILNKEMRIKGTYPGDDYGVIETDKFDPQLSRISEHIIKLSAESNTYRTIANNCQAELTFLNENLSESAKTYLDALYEENYGQRLFPDAPLDEINDALADFIKYTKNTNDDDYGWLEPDGTFHPVNFLEHEKFAVDFLNEHYPFKTHAHMYLRSSTINGKLEHEHIDGGDVLVYSLGWILLHNPRQKANWFDLEYDPSRRITTKQKDFLIEYCAKRNLSERNLDNIFHNY